MGVRIISGRLRGKKIQTPHGMKTRPTSDRLRETLFNIIGGLIKDACVLDLFSGSGAIGIEALSRDARFALFIDNDWQAMTVIKQNIVSCRLEEQSQVILWDIRKNLDCIATRPETFDMVFMDPPYASGMIPHTLKCLEKSGKLSTSALIVVEHATGEPVLVDSTEMAVSDVRNYGKTSATFLQFELKG